MAQLKTKNTWRANQTTVFALIGEVTVGENGEVEVPDALVQDFKSFYPEFEEGEDIKEKSESNDFGKSEDEEIPAQVEEETSLEDDEAPVNAEEVPSEEKVEEEVSTEEQNKQVVAHIEGLTLAELKEYASQYPKEETKVLKSKQSYVDFLISKLVG